MIATLPVAIRAACTGDVGALAYPVVGPACHFGIWAMVARAVFAARRPARDADRFRVGANHPGKAVFACMPLGEGERLFACTGRRLSAARVPNGLQGGKDRFVRVTIDHCMGPSGRIDDPVNHGCDPDAALRFGAAGVWPVALRPITAGEEMEWNHSATLGHGDWHMACRCPTPECAG